MTNGFWKDKQVCVTGGTGFLGYHLVQQLCAAGAQVRTLALATPPEHPLADLADVEQFSGDVRDTALVRRATAGCAVVFHTAGIVASSGPQLRLMHSVHVDGTRTVLAEMPATARLVHTSSITAVGAARRGRPATEETAFDLHDFAVDYVHAKRAAEHVALAGAKNGRDVVVANPAYLVGPEDYEGSVMGRFCLRFWKGRLPVAPPGGLNLVDVRDVAAGHLLAAERGRSGRRYILGGEDYSFRDFMGLLADVARLRPRLLPCWPGWALNGAAVLAELRGWLTHKEPYPALQHVRLNRVHWYVRSDRAVRELGYTARPLDRSLAETYRWYGTRTPLRLRGFNRWWMRAA